MASSPPIDVRARLRRIKKAKRLLAGRSARIVVTMGMPVLMYRWYFGAYGVRGFERSILSFAGIKPIRESFYGLAFANDKKRARWIEDMRRYRSRHTPDRCARRPAP